MAKRGRKMLAGSRTESGRLSRARETLPATRANALRAAAQDKRFASPAGLAFLAGELTSAQFEMAVVVDQKVAAYHRAIGAGGVRSPSSEPGRGAAPIDPDTDAGDAETRRFCSATRAYERLRYRLMFRGRAICEATLKFCIGVEHCEWREREWAKVGLDQLILDANGGRR